MPATMRALQRRRDLFPVQQDHPVRLPLILRIAVFPLGVLLQRLATRQSISDAATRLFIERGFDQVTVDEIAAAADVGRMTVFNHFPRKEDMFFDRGEEGREMLRAALRQRDPGVAPIEAYRLLAHRLVAERSPAVEFSARSEGFVATVEGSEPLKARARAIRDELAHVVTGASFN